MSWAGLGVEGGVGSGAVLKFPCLSGKKKTRSLRAGYFKSEDDTRFIFLTFVYGEKNRRQLSGRG
jgi:hypothetical protein